MRTRKKLGRPVLLKNSKSGLAVEARHLEINGHHYVQVEEDEAIVYGLVDGKKGFLELIPKDLIAYHPDDEMIQSCTKHIRSVIRIDDDDDDERGLILYMTQGLLSLKRLTQPHVPDDAMKDQDLVRLGAWLTALAFPSAVVCVNHRKFTILVAFGQEK